MAEGNLVTYDGTNMGVMAAAGHLVLWGDGHDGETPGYGENQAFGTTKSMWAATTMVGRASLPASRSSKTDAEMVAMVFEGGFVTAIGGTTDLLHLCSCPG